MFFSAPCTAVKTLPPSLFLVRCTCLPVGSSYHRESIARLAAAYLTVINITDNQSLSSSTGSTLYTSNITLRPRHLSYLRSSAGTKIVSTSCTTPKLTRKEHQPTDRWASLPAASPPSERSFCRACFAMSTLRSMVDRSHQSS